eukprot:CAMPEP_0119102084 /NCGR_PEP_ID=MMETSP1180-20130426/951_1 /TAXON_ID=3052 ORGANISM="Chlamydomonas cf sp, Strain CCMP681" /NCGR_SAMPLE_ID=MMETSP1180 /ASSEMBLY_ACC=CAM_ASM_000741 /LENGTH=323 /DNA_ID=CAMNT_0007086309 /DNA_START=70 /DNA_END=1042 /DNA_ORIENTATION=+
MHPGKLRVLCCHSFRTSAAIFASQLKRAQLDVGLGDLVEFVFMDAPNVASGHIPKDVASFFTGPYHEWMTVTMEGDKLVFDEVGLERSMAAITHMLHTEGPFDGVMGFSQGSVMASSIVALQSAGIAFQDLPRLKFAVLFAGFKSRYPQHASAWQQKVTVPSLHIFGDRDELKPECKVLADAFADAIILQHQRGHSIPAFSDLQLAVARTFLSSFSHTAYGAGPLHAQAQMTRQPTSAACIAAVDMHPRPSTQVLRTRMLALSQEDGSTADYEICGYMPTAGSEHADRFYSYLKYLYLGCCPAARGDWDCLCAVATCFNPWGG